MTVLTATVAAAVITGGLLVHVWSAGAETFPADVHGVTTLNALEFVASERPEDWVAVADVVVVAEAVSEKAHEAAISETTVESNLIGRTVTVEPTETIWTAKDSQRELPASVDLTQAGWVTNDGETAEVNLGYGSRIEVGHNYVLALVWMDEVCGEDPEPAQWAVIGSEGALPIDDGIVGRGEIGGVVTARADTSAFGKFSMLRRTAGKSVAAVRDALQAVSGKVERSDFWPPPPDEAGCAGD